MRKLTEAGAVFAVATAAGMAAVGYGAAGSHPSLAAGSPVVHDVDPVQPAEPAPDAAPTTGTEAPPGIFPVSPAGVPTFVPGVVLPPGSGADPAVPAPAPHAATASPALAAPPGATIFPGSLLPTPGSSLPLPSPVTQGSFGFNSGASFGSPISGLLGSFLPNTTFGSFLPGTTFPLLPTSNFGSFLGNPVLSPGPGAGLLPGDLGFGTGLLGAGVGGPSGLLVSVGQTYPPGTPFPPGKTAPTGVTYSIGSLFGVGAGLGSSVLPAPVSSPLPFDPFLPWLLDPLAGLDCGFGFSHHDDCGLDLGGFDSFHLHGLGDLHLGGSLSSLSHELDGLIGGSSHHSHH